MKSAAQRAHVARSSQAKRAHKTQAAQDNQPDRAHAKPRLNRPMSPPSHTSRKSHRTAQGGEAASQLKKRIKSARAMLAVMKKGDAEALQEAVLLQGLMSGDIFAANLRSRQILLRENLRLKQHFQREKIRTERLKQTLLEAAIPGNSPEPTTQLSQDTIARIREIYGLQKENKFIADTTTQANQIAIREHNIRTGRTIEVKALPAPEEAVQCCPASDADRRH